MRLTPLRNSRRSAVVIGCAGALAVALGIWVAIGAATGGAESAVASEEAVVAETMSTAAGGSEMMVSELMIPGPAIELQTGSPNRLGSEQVPVRLYEPEGEPWATLVWAHGGSFVHGDLDWPEAHWVSQKFADAGLRVYSVDYGLASEGVKAPAPANDVAAVLREVVPLAPGPVFVGGASAGANLAVQAALTQVAHATAQADVANQQPDSVPAEIAALILEYPSLHRVQPVNPEIAELTSALEERRQFGPERIAEMYDFYLAESAERAGSAALAPAPNGYPLAPLVVGELAAADLALLPPTVIVNAEADDLRASGEQFAGQLRDAGVPVATHTQPGTIHGYLNRPEETDQALRDAQQTIDFFVAELQKILQ
ncbi:MAG: alpha/beta hydrolase fold domain-containing protein [Leucobacter sp.]